MKIMVTFSKSLRFFWKENFLIKLSFCVLQLNFFTLFKLTNPKVQIEFIHFLTFMPWFVKYMKQWNTCCKYHTELRELVVGLDNVKCLSISMHGDCTWCACEVCQTNVRAHWMCNYATFIWVHLVGLLPCGHYGLSKGQIQYVPYDMWLYTTKNLNFIQFFWIRWLELKE